MTPKFTDQVTEALSKAFQMAQEDKKVEVSQSHLLWALLEKENSYFHTLLRALSLDPAFCKQKALEKAHETPSFSLDAETPILSTALQKNILDAQNCASKWGDTYISADHLLYVFWKENKEP